MPGFDDWNSALVHFGTKGMKWGTRKYQNEDGTYTEAGKERYFGSQYKAAHDSYVAKAKATLDKTIVGKALAKKSEESSKEESKTEIKKVETSQTKTEKKSTTDTSASSSTGKGKGKKKKSDKDKTKKGKAAAKQAAQKGSFDGSIHNRHVAKASAKGHSKWESMSKIKSTAMSKPVIEVFDTARYLGK